MQTFEIEIKNEKIKVYRTITLLLVIIESLLFCFLLLSTGEEKRTLISLGFLVSYTIYRFYICRKSNQSFFFDEWIFFMLMILWLNSNFFVAIANMVLFLLYTITTQKTIYSFDTFAITQKNFPWKKYQWKELSNVILKDDLLTLDFNNNKLIQKEIMNTKIDEIAFNEFARNQLTR